MDNLMIGAAITGTASLAGHILLFFRQRRRDLLTAAAAERNFERLGTEILIKRHVAEIDRLESRFNLLERKYDQAIDQWEKQEAKCRHELLRLERIKNAQEEKIRKLEEQGSAREEQMEKMQKEIENLQDLLKRQGICDNPHEAE